MNEWYPPNPATKDHVNYDSVESYNVDECVTVVADTSQEREKKREKEREKERLLEENAFQERDDQQSGERIRMSELICWGYCT